MNAQKRALLLVGSPKGANKSTSESLGTYLLDRLHERGLETENVRIHPSLKSDKSRENLLSTIDRSDILILAFPLYVDSLPAPVIRAMELIAAHRRAMENPKKPRLLAISNCGFPEAHHNDPALAICRRFAPESEIEWAGGLALGGGEIIQGLPLNKVGRVIRKVTKALDLTAAALAEGKSAPKEAMALMAKPLIPCWMYLLFAEMGWKRQARKYGVRRKLYDRPYQR